MVLLSRSLVVRANGQLVGYLHDGEQRVFEYSPLWLKRDDSFPLSPDLSTLIPLHTDVGQKRSVSWFFENLLPEGEVLKGIKAYYGKGDDTWWMLNWFGRETAGALSILPDRRPEEAAKQLVPLDQLHQRVKNNREIPLIASGATFRAIAGAQVKVGLDYADGQLYEPSGMEPTTHILKPDSPAALYPHTAANELFCMRLAAELGLDVPEVGLLRTPSPVFWTKRFDRDDANGQARHVIDGAQFMSVAPGEKYRLMTLETLWRCIARCKDHELTTKRLFEWTVFNLLIGNGDAHLKNLSFFLDSKGLTLTPFYDLVSTVVYAVPDNQPFHPYWPDVAMSIKMSEAKRFNEISRKRVVAFGSDLGLVSELAENILDSMLASIEPVAAAVAQRLDLTAEEQQLVTAIRTMPIREMAQRLGQ